MLGLSIATVKIPKTPGNRLELGAVIKYEWEHLALCLTYAGVSILCILSLPQDKAGLCKHPRRVLCPGFLAVKQACHRSSQLSSPYRPRSLRLS